MAVLDRVPVDRITDQARQVHPVRTLLTVLAGLLYGLGWVVAKTFMALWFAGAWCAVAVKVGWVDARNGRGDGSRL